MPQLMAFEAERRRMIDVQLRHRGIRDPRVLDAMLHVPRHEFVPQEYMELAYQDRALPIGARETISQPYMVAAMTEAADIAPGDKVLEIGTGSGYQAAILAYLGARLYSIEKNTRLAAKARATLARLGYSELEIICADGTEGYAAAAPYQAILVTAGSPQVPSVLVDQLSEGGHLVIPVGSRELQRLELVQKTSAGTATQFLDACQFVPLTGKYGWPASDEL